LSEDLTVERIAENQSTFRVANEQIEAAAEHMGLLSPVPFICECAETQCTEVVRLTLDEYEDVRVNPRLFFTAPGHQQIAVAAGAGVVIAATDGHVLVEKVGLAGEIAADEAAKLGQPDE